MSAVPAALGRQRGSTAQRLRHETLALRLVSLTTRLALQDLDRLPPSTARDARAEQLSTWIDGVLAYHRGRIRLLREAPAEPGTAEALAAVEQALLDAEAVQERTNSWAVERRGIGPS